DARPCRRQTLDQRLDGRAGVGRRPAPGRAGGRERRAGGHRADAPRVGRPRPRRVLTPPAPGRLSASARPAARARGVDELEEAALPPGLRAVLVEELEPLLVELLEELVPGDRFERRIATAFPPVAGEVDAQHAGLIARCCAPDGGRVAAALFDPAADRLVVGRAPGAPAAAAAARLAAAAAGRRAWRAAPGCP